MSATSGNYNAFRRWDSQVTSPWSSLSRKVYPRTVGEVFAWAEELWLHHGLYSSAIKKSIRYFMTELELTGGDEVDRDARGKYMETLQENFDLMEEAGTVGDDYIGFGNSFTSLSKPFIRTLICDKCGFRAPVGKMAPHFKFEGLEFRGTCPTCNRGTTYTREDQARPSEGAKPVITRWPPQFMEIKHHPLSQRKKFTLDTTKYDALTEGIRAGDLMFLEDTPWEIIEAVSRNQKFVFEDGEIYHMAYPPPAVMLPYVRGWGVPPFMNEFETALLVTMLDKYTEAILIDYLIPFRLISPPAGNGSAETDPMLQIDMGDFKQQMNSMIARHRRNPTGYNYSPFPVEYQVLGGEAKDIAPIEIQQHFEQRLLNSMGIPSDFYQGSFQATGNNAGPMLGFKMFERQWQYFANELNKWLTWLVNKQGELENWEKVTVALAPMSVYEDPEIRDIRLQLAAANEVSKKTAWKALQINPEAERKQVMEEQKAAEEDMMKAQKELEDRGSNMQAALAPSAGMQIAQEDEAAAAAAQGGMPAPSGAPPPGGGAGGMGAAPSLGSSLDELMVEADTIAQQLFSLDPLARRRALGDLKSSNEALYAQVKASLQEMETEAKSQGVQAARQGPMQ